MIWNRFIFFGIGIEIRNDSSHPYKKIRNDYGVRTFMNFINNFFNSNKAQKLYPIFTKNSIHQRIKHQDSWGTKDLQMANSAYWESGQVLDSKKPLKK